MPLSSLFIPSRRLFIVSDLSHTNAHEKMSVWLAGILQLSGCFGVFWRASEKRVFLLPETSGAGWGFQFPLPWLVLALEGGWLRKGGIHSNAGVWTMGTQQQRVHNSRP